MKKIVFLPVVFLLWTGCSAHVSKQSLGSDFAGQPSLLNLSLSEPTSDNKLPALWNFGQMPGYEVVYHQDSSARSLELIGSCADDRYFGVFSNEIPLDLVRGRNVEFRGEIRTYDVADGYAGLWFRVDSKGDGKILKLDNMSDRGVSGTTGWIPVAIRMDVPFEAGTVIFGGLLVGNGSAAFRNLELYIDGEKFDDRDPNAVEPTQAEIAWLRQYIYPLRTCDPADENQDDLLPLGRLIGDAKTVALGEASHGSSEIFRMKHRILRYLAEKKDFDIFSIEANMPEAYRVNDYVLNGDGDPARLIVGMYFWTWSTQEVLDMVKWMRNFNDSRERKLQFTGFDMQFADGPVSELRKELGDKDAGVFLDNLESELKRVKADLSRGTLKVEDRRRLNALLDKLELFVDEQIADGKTNAWLHRNLLVVRQSLDQSSYTVRDRYMAENLLWIRKQNPESKVVVWAHNGHIRETEPSMGSYLSQALGKDYVSVGFAFDDGSFTAVGRQGLASYPARKSYPGTYEYVFGKIDEPIFLLDLKRAAADNSPDGEWLRRKLKFRSIGSVSMLQEFFPTDLLADYDLIIFIRTSSASRLLPEYYGKQ